MKLIKYSICAITFLISACSTSYQAARNVVEVDLSEDVREASLDYNEAYNKAVNSQILLNILRARDRLPRRYTTLSELALTPSSVRAFQIDPTGIKLGNNGIDPWITFGGQYKGNRTDNLSFKVTPAISEQVQTFYNPIDLKIVQRYFDSGWSKDLIYRTLLNDFRRLGGSVGTVKKPCDEKDYRKPYQDHESFDCLIIRVLSAPRPFEMYVSDEISVFCFADFDCTVENDEGKEDKKIIFNNKSSVNYIKDNNLSASNINSKIELSYTTNTQYSGNKNRQMTYVGGFVYCYESDNLKYIESPASGDKVVFRQFHCSLNSSYSPTPDCVKRNEETDECKTFETFSQALFYVQRHDNSDHSDQSGMYSVQRNSIDQIIYNLGEELRTTIPGESLVLEGFGNQTMQTSQTMLKLYPKNQPKNPNTETEIALISLLNTMEGALSDDVSKNCSPNDFVASVRYRDERIFAGGPQNWKRKDSRSKADEYDSRYCQFNDRTGTLFTLISQIIEASQNPDKIENNNVFLR